jgi:hypothetical protein
MNTCIVPGCQRDRLESAVYCKAHLAALWRNEPVVVDHRPAWIKRMQAVGLPAKEYKP